MIGGKKLGFCWGHKRFYIVETQGPAPVRTIDIPLIAPDGSGEIVADAVHLTAFVQKAMRQDRINPSQVRLSLPAGDCIIRSFVLPFMKPSEVGPAVEFEIRKYIPFSLKDLAWAYHPVVFTENKIKKLRIVFVATRRDFLEKCTKVLSAAGLQVVFSEPAPLSMLRGMITKKLIASEQITAVVDIRDGVGRILFCQHGAVYLVHEFNTHSDEIQDLTALRPRVLNEAHNSFEFYNRQFPGQPVSKILVLSMTPEVPYGQWLKEDMGIPVQEIDPGAIVRSADAEVQMDAACSYGASLADESRSPVIFNLSRKTVKHPASLTGGALFDYKEYAHTIKVAGAALVVSAGAYFWTQGDLENLKTSVNALTDEQIEYQSMSQDDIRSKTTGIDDAYRDYKAVVLKSGFYKIFYYLPTLLPDGVWIRDIFLTNSGKNQEFQVTINGYAYDKDQNRQIKLVNEFVSAMKKHKALGQFFKNVNLTSILRESQEGKVVVAFTVICN